MITTENLIAGKKSARGEKILQATNPVTQTKLPEKFFIATADEIDLSVKAAYDAWKVYQYTSGKERAAFLRKIADEIEALGDVLVNRVMQESGLPEGRVRGERGRTCGQLRLFASMVEEGSWQDAVIDEAIPDRKPLPRADIRKVSVAIGPVAIFTASNFPLAFSTAGGDSTSALAAGCPVVVKAHPSHLGTNALVSGAIATAAAKTGMPSGVFSSVNGGIEAGRALVMHPMIKGVGFTGSYRGGKAIFDMAAGRPEPIPVYAEMGSNNPIFILPQKLKGDFDQIATTIAGSVNLGAGQFCTNPGILVIQESTTTNAFLESLKKSFSALTPATMLNEGIYKAYEEGRNACSNEAGVALQHAHSSSGNWTGSPAFATVRSSEFIANKKLQEEVFGPFTLVVLCAERSEVIEVAKSFRGQLTASIMGTDEDITKACDLVSILATKAGRVIFNDVPTGVEVCHAMHHGGPFPATTNALFTSVGTDAIKRFVRPVTYQNAPQSLLPDALKDGNPLGIWRKINGELSRS